MFYQFQQIHKSADKPPRRALAIAAVAAAAIGIFAYANNGPKIPTSAAEVAKLSPEDHSKLIAYGIRSAGFDCVKIKSYVVKTNTTYDAASAICEGKLGSNYEYIVADIGGKFMVNFVAKRGETELGITEAEHKSRTKAGR